jgi:6-phosphogluconolactonase (cycloisomerase 2 family)
MNRQARLAQACFAALVSVFALGSFPQAHGAGHRTVNGTIWVANRGSHTIQGFDPDTGAVVRTVAMAPSSQPGDLAFAKGKLYVAEEFGTPPALAVVDEETGAVIKRISFPQGSRPHHVHVSAGGNLVATGLFGTDLVAVVNTHDDTLVGVWDSNPITTNGRVHAAVFSQNAQTLYLASDASNEVIALDPRTGQIFWRMTVPAAHELAVTHDGKTAYVSRRTANRLAVIDLKKRTFEDLLALGLPDTLRLSANEHLLTVGLRTMPAQLAVMDTRTLVYNLVDLSAAGELTTIGGHQWTSRSGRFTFASFEGGTSPGVAVIDHRAGNQVVQRWPYPGRPHGVDHARP